MANKIIGFTVSQSKIDHGDVDIFNRGLCLEEMEINGFYVYIWGINQIKKCIVDGKYSLSFPLNDDLLDRNVLIYADDNNIIIENDWLGSIPIFYNEKDLIVSTLSLKTLVNPSIHPEGLANFVEFGYSVFEQTPFKNVKFMRYYSKLVITEKGIKTYYKDDPAIDDALYRNSSDEATVFNRVKNYVNSVESKIKGEIIIPTSGGYDSRFLNICVDDKSRVRSYTYGICKEQSKSFEVVYAKKVSEILGTQWAQIELGKYHQYIEEWFKIYGISTHLHGMYHIEFYSKIIRKTKFTKDATFLSGIVADGWAGNVNVGKIQNYKDLTKLGYSHGLHAENEKLLIHHDSYLKKKFFHENKKNLVQKTIRIIFLIRFKIILLSYLTVIPEYFGFPVWTPFLNFKIALGILNLPKNRREKRKWQMDLFRENDLNIEEMKLTKDCSNTLNFQAYENHNFYPLDIEVLSVYFNESYLESINFFITKNYKNNLISQFIQELTQNKYLGYFMKCVGIKNMNNFPGLSAYYVLNVIEKGLKHKNYS